MKTYMVPMRDRVRLATDVQLGKGRGPWPVLLLRTPYGRKNMEPGKPGSYVMVRQDVRGRYDSEGRAVPFVDDAWGRRQDGFDIVKWILAQPWCNGKVGTIGGSAPGMTQSMLAGAHPPNVLAQHIWVAAGSIYHHFAYGGGAFQESLFGGWIEAAKWPRKARNLALAHPFYDDFWRGLDADARVVEQRISIPCVHCAGWYDMFPDAAIDSFLARSAVAPNQWLIIGPWPHGTVREVGELVYPPNALVVPTPGHDTEVWYDFWLKGRANGMDGIPRVQYYVMGACGEKSAPGNRWRSADSWPPIAAQSVPYFITADRCLTRRAPVRQAAIEYHYNPANPVPTRGGRNMFIPAGPMDQREIERRPDVLVFTTPSLGQPLEVTGRIMMRLYASSSAHDTMFTAKVCDVYPDGRSMIVADGVLRAACRESLSSPSPLEPERVYEFSIVVGSTSLIFNRGHRIRLSISSSNYPRFAVHPNVWGDGKPRVARQHIVCGGQMASALVLPVVGK